jgi:hypothetical protein
MNKSIIAPVAIIVIFLSVIVYAVGHNVGYNEASTVFAKVYSEKLSTEEQNITSDCLTKNGFVLNDVTYLCQPIMPVPSYAQ